jgi:hypothetical protein
MRGGEIRCTLAFERLRFLRETLFRAHGGFPRAPHILLNFPVSASIKHDDAVISITVRDERFVCLRIHLHIGWASKILRVVVALACVGVSNLA